METTEQKINLQLNIDGHKFFETNQLFDDDQTYLDLIQGFMDDLNHKLENMMDSEDEPVNEELYYNISTQKNHGTENPCHTFRVDNVTFYIIIK